MSRGCWKASPTRPSPARGGVPPTRTVPVGRLEQPGDQPQQRALAAAVRADDHRERAGRHLEAAVGQASSDPRRRRAKRTPTPSMATSSPLALGCRGQASALRSRRSSPRGIDRTRRATPRPRRPMRAPAQCAVVFSLPDCDRRPCLPRRGRRSGRPHRLSDRCGSRAGSRAEPTAGGDFHPAPKTMVGSIAPIVAGARGDGQPAAGRASALCPPPARQQEQHDDRWHDRVDDVLERLDGCLDLRVVLADHEAGEMSAAFHGSEPSVLNRRKRPIGMRLMPAG